MPESEFIVCRICLTEEFSLENMTPLFDERNMPMDLVGKIEEVGNIKVMPLDIPSMLCDACVDSLGRAHQFRELCQASERTFANNVVKAEMKSEPTDQAQIESHHIEFIYDAANDFIDADEDIELDDIMEERLEDDMTEDQIVCVGDGDADDAPEPIGIGDIFDQSSDSDYNPIERVRKSKIRKTRKSKTHAKRGRPRKVVHFSSTKSTPNEDSDSIITTKSIKPIVDNPTNIMCEICGNIYSKRGALNIHMRRHLADKPFECEICSKTFAGPSELNRHIRVHTGEKPFTCKYCSRSFADRSSNIRHERTHTNERPFTCTTCGKSFSYSNVLKNHMLTHTGEKPFLCLPCNKTFSRKHQLEQHIGTLTHQQTINALEPVNESPNVASISMLMQ